jgi:hypothetical protein
VGGFREIGSEFGGSYGAGTGMNMDEILHVANMQIQGLYSVYFRLRIPTGFSAGVPEAGHQVSMTFKEYMVRGYLYEVTPKEVFLSGGALAQGDMIVGFDPRTVPGDVPLKGGQAETAREGLRFVLREDGLEYRIVGEAQIHPLGTIAGIVEFQLRKVGRS